MRSAPLINFKLVIESLRNSAVSRWVALLIPYPGSQFVPISLVHVLHLRTIVLSLSVLRGIFLQL